MPLITGPQGDEDPDRGLEGRSDASLYSCIRNRGESARGNSSDSEIPRVDFQYPQPVTTRGREPYINELFFVIPAFPPS